MFNHTADVMEDTHALRDYDVVFLAALVGLDSEAKVRVVEHLARHMGPGAVLMLRSTHGAWAFLYPVVDPGSLRGFEVLSVFHPTDEVINSVVVARRSLSCGHPPAGIELVPGPVVLPCKCFDLTAFNPLGRVLGPHAAVSSPESPEFWDFLSFLTPPPFPHPPSPQPYPPKRGGGSCLVDGMGRAPCCDKNGLKKGP